MIFGAALACILLGLTAGYPAPVRQRDAHGNSGYEYGVKHPAGSSRVHVQTGSNKNGLSYPGKFNNLQNSDYIASASYLNPRASGPHYHPQSYEQPPLYDSSAHPKHFHGQRIGNVPVYEEHNYRPRHAHVQNVPKRDSFRAYEDSHARNPENYVISQQNLDNEPFHSQPEGQPVDSRYARPHFVQQVADEPNTFVQLPLDDEASYGSAPESLPIDNPFHSQPILQQTSSDDIFPNDEPNIYNQPDSQIVLQEPIPSIVDDVKPSDEQLHIDQKALDFPSEEGPISQQHIDNKPLYSQVPDNIPSIKSVPIHSETPLQQQEFIDVSPPIDPPPSFAKFQPNVVSQEVLDSKPSFDLDAGNYPPSKIGVIYNEHDTVQEFIGDSNVKYNPAPLIGQQPLNDIVVIDENSGSPIAQTSIDQHPSQAIYDSSIEPSFSDTDEHFPKALLYDQPKYHFVPIGKPYEKLSHSTEIVHGPPRNFYGRTKKSPISYSVKHPPPSKEFLYPPHSQEFLHVGAPHTKNPPYSHTVKLPPQEHLNIDVPHTKNPLPYQSIKLPPQSQKSLFVDFPHTKNPPFPHSVKLPPQEHLNIDAPHTKNPPPYQSIKLPPQSQEPLILDVPTTKNIPVSHSVKLPPQEPLHQDIVSVKSPPVSHSIKLPPLTQEPVLVDAPLVQYPPVSHSIKLPQSQEPLHVAGPFTKNPPPPHLVKLPQSQEPLHVDGPFTKNPPLPHSIKLPQSQEPLHVDGPFTKNVPLPHSVKLPPQEPLHVSIPHTKNPPSYPSIKLPPQSQEPINVDVPTTKNVPLSHSVKLPPQEPLHFDTVSIKNPPSVKLPPQLQEPLHVDGPFTKNPPPPLSHSVKLPPQQSLHTDPAITNYHPITHSVKIPQSQEPLYVNAPPPISHSIKSPAPYSVKHPSAATLPHSHLPAGNPHINYPLQPKIHLVDDSPVSGGVNVPYSAHPEEFDSIDTPDITPYNDPPKEKSPFEKYAPVSHSVRLPVITQPKYPATETDKITNSVSHAIRLPNSVYKPQTTSLPNLFAAIPQMPPSSDDKSELNTPISHSVILPQSSASPVAEPLVSGHFNPPSENSHSPLSHSVRIPVPHARSANNHGVLSKESGGPGGYGNQGFPDFPVKSALAQDDPVADKVSELSRGYGNGRGAEHIESGYEPEEDGPSNSPSVNDAKLEIDRINKEIGVSFGSRIARNPRFN